MIQVLWRRTAYTNSSDEVHLSIARFSEQTLALITVSASSLPDVGEDGLAIVDISKLTTVKVLDCDENRKISRMKGDAFDPGSSSRLSSDGRGFL
jgi:hypothetical protein